MVSSAVTSVVDQLAEELGRSVVINDPSVQVLYASAHYGDADPVRIRALLDHGAEPRARGHVLAQGVSTWSRAGVVPALDEIGMHARVCAPVRFDGELLALLVVMDADGSLSTAELGRVHEAASEVAYALHAETSRSGPEEETEQLVLDLVGDDPGARRRAAAALSAITSVGAGAERFAAVTALDVVVAPTSRTATTTATLPHVQTALRSALTARSRTGPADEVFAVADGAAVVLLGGRPCAPDAAERRAGEVLERTHEMAAGRFECIAGVGSTGEGLEHAVTSMRQARLARRAAELGLRGPVSAWTSLGAYGPLLAVPAERLDEASLPQELQRLLAVDADGKLAPTVRAYLDAAGNGPAAAAALHVHRTSLYYRLGRVLALTGLDVADGRTRLALHTGFAVLDLVEAHRRAARGAFDSRSKTDAGSFVVQR